MRAAFLLLLAIPACLNGSSGRGPAVTVPPAEGLGPEGQAALGRLANEEFCSCGCPHTVAACLQAQPACKHGLLLHRTMARFLAEGFSEGEVLALVDKGLLLSYRSAPEELDETGAAARGDGKITIVEFADFECPACRETEPVLQALLAERPDVRLVFKHFPLRQHASAIDMAVAAEAAAQQGKFWEMHDRLFAEDGVVTRSDLVAQSLALGLDVARFEGALDDPALRAKVMADRDQGLRAGVDGTPGIFVNGRRFLLPRTRENLIDRISLELERGVVPCE